MNEEQLRQIIAEEVMRVLGTLRPSSVEMTQNHKAERTVTVKEYQSDVKASYALVSEVFDRAVRDLPLFGTADSPVRARLNLPDLGRQERD